MEVLDFAGPFEVFSVANELKQGTLFEISVVGYRNEIIRCRNGLKIIADQLFNPNELPDILIIPGGKGTRALLNDLVLRG